MTTLQQQAESDSAPWLIANRNAETLSAAGIFGKRQSATTGLIWGYYGGLYNGNTIADGTVTLTNAATNYVVVLRSTGVVSTSTSSANSLNPAYAKLYTLTTAGSVVTVEVDSRWDANGLFFSGGSTTAANIPAQRYTVELLNTTDSDPGAGLIKFNNATPASATALYIDDSTSDGVDLSTYFAGLGATGYITIQSTTDAGEWVIFKWTGITDQTGYFRFTVTSYASLGTLDDADAVVIAFDSDAAGGGGGGATSGTYASRPSAATAGAGAIYYATDALEQYLSNGSVWAVISGGTELGYAQITSSSATTASATYADISGLSVTCVVGERPITIHFGGQAVNDTAARYTTVDVQSNGVTKGESTFQSSLAAAYGFISLMGRDSGLTPGTSYTFKARYKSPAAGNAQIYADANGPAWIRVVAG